LIRSSSVVGVIGNAASAASISSNVIAKTSL
jgi:hypothetical protein